LLWDILLLEVVVVRDTASGVRLIAQASGDVRKDLLLHELILHLKLLDLLSQAARRTSIASILAHAAIIVA